VVAPMTTLAGLYQRSADHHDRPPYDLPDRWEEQKSAVGLETPYNFITTCDIIGGDSGSPVVGRDGELVGVAFDGNAGSLSAGIAYDGSTSRAVCVHGAGILEALRNVYGAGPLADELVSGRR
jgi:hypothetical protein